jgi:ribulose-5-phosphate 4-epimerase/fuculose-1-phosphate aldolase
MANHGLLVYAPTLSKALYIATEVENLAKQYLHLLASGQPFTILDDKEMAKILELAKGYGKQDSNANRIGHSITFPPRVEEGLLAEARL